MSQAPIMPFYTDAYLADTHHLPTEAHGAYLLLLLYCWRANGKPAPNDDRLLARITRLSPMRWQRQIRPAVQPFFTIDESGWRQKRLEETWAQVQRKIALQREKGLRSGQMRQQRHKPLRVLDSGVTEGATPLQPSNEPVSHKPLSHSNIINGYDAEGEAEATPALEALQPLLSDVRYFVKNHALTPSPSLKPQLQAAADEINRLTQAMGAENAARLMDQLRGHFPKASTEEWAAHQHWFADYPYDLARRAIAGLLIHYPYPTLPRIALFAAEMEPELKARHSKKQRIERLLTAIPRLEVLS